MIISKIKTGCRVGFFGLGKSNVSLLYSLLLENCRITLRSDLPINPENIPKNVRVDRIFLGCDACRDIDEDIIFFSPSVRREREELIKARERGVIFSSDAEMFFEENRIPTFAVTGSDGKSTTAMLIHLLLTASGYKSRLIGNIGEPMYKETGGDCDFFVCEMSSFMLRYINPSVRAACITNVTPNHLDWHKDFTEYRETKLSIGRNAERLIISDENADIPDAYGIISDKKDFRKLKKIYDAHVYLTKEDGYICKNGEKLIKISEIRRNEAHNLKNLMMAIAMTDGLINKESILEVAADFRGLAHRCQIVLSRGGVDYIDSSIDSTPARTAQTLNSLGRSVVIILGGRGKRLDYGELLPSLKQYAKKVIICGENAEEIYAAISNDIHAEIIDDFEVAVVRGAKLAKEVGTLLLSPASTSYDKFKNYAERGDKFKHILQKND